MNIIKSIIFLVLLFLVGCSEKKSHITEENVNKLKQKYTSEAINYFYETVFFSEGEQMKIQSIRKWEENIKIVILGNPSKKDISILRSSIQKINNEKLGISCSIIKDIKKANVKIYFDVTDKIKIPNIIKNDSINGYNSTTFFKGEIKSGEIGIVNIENKISYDRKRGVVMEELAQIHGVQGDSYSYPSSVFYEGVSFDDELSELDKQVLKLLYDPLIPANYPRTYFEEDFKDILHSYKASEKIRKLIYTMKLSKGALKKIKNSCFINNEFYKHPKHTNIYIQGSYTSKDSLNLRKVINSINKISNNLNLSIKSYNANSSDAGIFINFEINEKQKNNVKISNVTYKGLRTMYPKRIRSNIKVSYNKNKKIQSQKNNGVTTELYKSLGPIEFSNLKNLYYEENDSIHFNEEFKAILNFIYNNTFIDGYTKDEFRRLIEEVN